MDVHLYLLMELFPKISLIGHVLYLIRPHFGEILPRIVHFRPILGQICLKLLVFSGFIHDLGRHAKRKIVRAKRPMALGAAFFLVVAALTKRPIE